MTYAQVHECRTSGLSDAYLGRKWRVDAQTVRDARKGKTYRDHPTPPDTRPRVIGAFGRYSPPQARLLSDRD